MQRKARAAAKAGRLGKARNAAMRPLPRLRPCQTLTHSRFFGFSGLVGRQEVHIILLGIE